MNDVLPPTQPWQVEDYPPRCSRCFYLIEGLADNGLCPECGAASSGMS
ncbi:MAG: hypothetical protein SGJ09_07740 [Phycisphaerae bacterium]|nr:hypothetical protein [Phycisphaerae bacterium]